MTAAVTGTVVAFTVCGVAVAVVGLLGCVLLRRRYLLVTVDGESMLPTYRPGDHVLVRRTPPDAARAGQVVVFRGHGAPGGHDPRQPSPVRGCEGPRPRWIIKRVEAAPGDPIPRDTVPALRSAEGTRVPRGNLVVLGDNPDRSHDSRRSGYLAAGRVYGVVLRKVGS